MQWSLRIAAAVALAWVAFAASPFVALHNLGRALQERDVAAIRKRVNFPAVRLSLLRQLANAYADEIGGRDLDRGQRQLAMGAAVAVADPIIAQVLTPEAILALLGEGRLQIRLAGGELRPDGAPSSGSAAPTADEPVVVQTVGVANALSVRSLGSAWRLYANSEMRGFRHILVSAPLRQPPEQQFRLRLRLSGITWRLVSVELPPSVVQRLLRQLPKPPIRQGEMRKGADLVRPS
jgi:hypothetical protein